MATVDIVVITRKGIDEEAKGPITSMHQQTTCFCRNEKTGAMLHNPWECNKGKHHVRMMPPIFGSSVVHWARNQAVSQAMHGQPEGDGRPPTEYFLLLDDDMCPEPHYLTRLLSYKTDIVCGICTVRRDPPRPNIRYWNPTEGRFIDPIKWDWKSQKLMEIDGAGAAFMLVKRGVFEKMGEAYRSCHFEMEEYARMGGLTPNSIEKFARWSERRKLRYEQALEGRQWTNADCWWFQFLANVVEGQIGEIGEDLSFCWKAKQLGFRIYADPQVLPGHLGNYAYSIRDWQSQVEQAIESGDLKIENMPVNEPALAVGA